MSETLTPTRHKAAALTAASALAMYDAAGCVADRARAAAAMAEVLRAKLPKPKPVKHVTEDGTKRSLTFVATDGHRMLKDSRVRADFPLSTPAVIIPRKAVAWMLRHVHDAEMRLDVWDGRLRLTTATGTFQTKTIDGNFPNYNQIIPADRAKTMLSVSDPKAFGDAITRLTSQNKGRSRTVALTCQSGVVRASSRTLEGAAIEAVLPAKLMGRERGLPSFNGVLLREMVGKDQAVTIDLNGENDPALFLWTDAPGRCGVLMPLRV